MKRIDNIPVPPTYDKETAQYLKSLREAITELQNKVKQLEENIVSLSKRR